MNPNHPVPSPATLAQLVEAEITAMTSDMATTFGPEIAQRLAERVRQQLLTALDASDADDRPHPPTAALLRLLAQRMGNGG